MTVSRREYVLLLVTLTVALYGVSVILARPKLEEWRKLRAEQAEVVQQTRQDRQLVESRESWQERFDTVSRVLTEHPADKKMDIHWLSVMDRLASRHGVRITKRQVGEERRVGDVYELPIECKEWESDLESLVLFLFDLQSEGAMLDVRQLYIKPRAKGQLRGRFLLYCAYTRVAAGETAE